VPALCPPQTEPGMQHLHLYCTLQFHGWSPMAPYSPDAQIGPAMQLPALHGCVGMSKGLQLLNGELYKGVGQASNPPDL
jgi:hypothetical protein